MFQRIGISGKIFNPILGANRYAIFLYSRSLFLKSFCYWRRFFYDSIYEINEDSYGIHIPY